MGSLFDISPDLFVWVVLPLSIFLARTFDMALSTLRMVFITQGRAGWAAGTGFVESLIWLLIIGKALQYLSNPLSTLAYAGGFAAGNLVGLRIEERLALGLRLLRVIVRDDPEKLVGELRELGFGATVVDGEGREGLVKILFVAVRRRDMPRAMDLVARHQTDAFVTVEDLRQVTNGFLSRGILAPSAPPTLRSRRSLWQTFNRKSK